MQLRRKTKQFIVDAGAASAYFAWYVKQPNDPSRVYVDTVAEFPSSERSRLAGSP
jgi:hypothetical protein